MCYLSLCLQACDALVQLIKDHGRWVEPSKEEDEAAPAEAVAVTA